MEICLFFFLKNHTHIVLLYSSNLFLVKYLQVVLLTNNDIYYIFILFKKSHGLSTEPQWRLWEFGTQMHHIHWLKLVKGVTYKGTERYCENCQGSQSRLRDKTKYLALVCFVHPGWALKAQRPPKVKFVLIRLSATHLSCEKAFSQAYRNWWSPSNIYLAPSSTTLGVF